MVTATKAAQALVEEAHREIELSGIQPVLRLAFLDTKIPLSMLHLPSDPASTTPKEPIGCCPSGLDASNGQTCLTSPPISSKSRRRVLWNSQQLGQVMSDVAQHKGDSLDIAVSDRGRGGGCVTPVDMADVALQRAHMAMAMSTEAVAGSPTRDLDLPDQCTMTTQLSLGQSTESHSSSGMPLNSRKRSIDRMVSPFALAPAPSRS